MYNENQNNPQRILSLLNNEPTSENKDDYIKYHLQILDLNTSFQYSKSDIQNRYDELTKELNIKPQLGLTSGERAQNALDKAKSFLDHIYNFGSENIITPPKDSFQQQTLNNTPYVQTNSHTNTITINHTSPPNTISPAPQTQTGTSKIDNIQES
ncbi:hypothetical protein L3V82_07320 [Thiotrichales bacterium 19S3-7]|nr:hypothetical protein [Thiotrichales bacterium 19S3-7]MCF6801967.1 hypothetical protein [Thiotrichales bacterium 19S3-11]